MTCDNGGNCSDTQKHWQCHCVTFFQGLSFDLTGLRIVVAVGQISAHKMGKRHVEKGVLAKLFSTSFQSVLILTFILVGNLYKMNKVVNHVIIWCGDIMW